MIHGQNEAYPRPLGPAGLGKALRRPPGDPRPTAPGRCPDQKTFSQSFPALQVIAAHSGAERRGASMSRGEGPSPRSPYR
jgi:hypothetical protein